MSEQIKHTSKEQQSNPHEHEASITNKELLNSHEIHSEHERQKELVDEARQDIEKAALSSKDKVEQISRLNETETVSTDSDRVAIADELLDVVKRREIKNIQRQQSPAQRMLSKVIHQPTVSTISEFSSKTVTRPSGLLGGGIVALVGTSIYYYLSKHIGFRYNYLIVFMLFIGGFILGTAIELIVYMSSKKDGLD